LSGIDPWLSGKVGAGETALSEVTVGLALVTTDAGAIVEETNAWVRAVSACNSESSADESLGVVGGSGFFEASGAGGAIRANIAGSAMGVAVSVTASSLAAAVGFCSARDFSVAAKDAGAPAGVSVSATSSALGREALSRLGICMDGITACVAIGNSDILFFETPGFLSEKNQQNLCH
jgi:hypothetical protein